MRCAADALPMRSVLALGSAAVGLQVGLMAYMLWSTPLGIETAHVIAVAHREPRVALERVRLCTRESVSKRKRHGVRVPHAEHICGAKRLRLGL